MLLATIAVAITLTLTPVRGQRAPAAGARIAQGELLVRFRAAASPAARDAAVSPLAGIVRRFTRSRVHQVRLRPGISMAAALVRLRNDPDVLSAEPNYIRHITATAPPNDPLWLNDSLWGLKRIQAPQVWSAFTTGTSSLVVADLDTGVNYTHPDLAPNMWRNPGEIPANGIDDEGDGYVDDVYGIDTANDDADPIDDHGHGTHTAGTIGGRGNNGIGVTGVTWNSQILACKFMDSTGSGTDADAIDCFEYVVMLKQRGVNIRVTSNSWGALREPGEPPSQALTAAIDAAGAAGILNVFAAGNDARNVDNAPFDPASFTSPSIVSVAASDGSDLRAGFSNVGAVAIDLAAPGVGIVSTYGTGYASISGTSMATPHVAGAAALVLAQRPGLSVAQLKTALLQSVDPLPQWAGLVASGGRLNVYKAVLASGPNIAPVISLTAPSDGFTYVAPATVAVAADASDPDGSIARVDFLLNGAVAASVTNAPFTAIVTGLAPGVYSVAATAIDNNGASTTSETRTITVTPGGSLAAVSFVGLDTTTQGAWKGRYGADGQVIVGDTARLPADTSVAAAGANTWVWSSSTGDQRALERAAGDRVMAAWYGGSFTIEVDVRGAERQVALYAADYDSWGRQQTIDVLDAATGAALDRRTWTAFSGGQYLVWTFRGRVLLRVTGSSGPNALVSGLFLGGPASGSGGGAASVAFEGSDTTTAGTWKGTFGADGYAIAGEPSGLPSYAQLSMAGQNTYVWAQDTADPRALQKAGGSRAMSAWYGGQIDFDLTVAGSTPRQVAFYMADFDPWGRQARLDVIDAGNGAVLDARTVSSFAGGQWLVWNIAGHVVVRVTALAGPNAVVSGVMFGAGGTPLGTGTSAVFRAADDLTRGSWQGIYGGGSYAIAGDSTMLTNGSRLAVVGQSSWTWSDSSTDDRALQRGGAGRVMAAWYGPSFDFDVALTGSDPQRVAIYCADFDPWGREQRVAVLDADTGAVLDTRVLADFSGGRYLTWDVRGHVIIRITRLSGPNAVVSGAFIG